MFPASQPPQENVMKNFLAIFTGSLQAMDEWNSNGEYLRARSAFA